MSRLLESDRSSSAAVPPVAERPPERDAGRASLRDKSYAAGAAELAPGGARDQAAQPAGPGGARDAAGARGSGMVIASSGSAEITSSGPKSMTRSLAGKIDGTERPIDDLIAETTDEVAPGLAGPQHPTRAMLGDVGAHAFGAGGAGVSRRGVGVTNNAYAGLGTRPTYQSTFPIMNALEGRGFDIARHMNLGAAGMRAAYGAGAAAVAPGDELVMTFGGHGSPEGLVGVDATHENPDLLPHAEFNGMVQRAVDAGAHVRAVVFACYSGQGTADLRSSEAARLMRSPKADQQWLSRFQVVRTFRDRAQRVGRDLVQSEDRAIAQAEADVAVRLPGPDQEAARAEALAQIQGQRHAELVQALEDFWFEMRQSLLMYAEMIAEADGQPARAIPEQIDARRSELGDGHAGLALGSELDCIDDLETRILALAAGPSDKLTAG